MVTIAIVAGEISGDYLAAGLIKAVRQRIPDVNFIGIAGPRMIEAGCEAHYAQCRLAVMGFTEALTRLPEIYRIRRRLRKYLLNNPPDLMIGVDAPDFNLDLELKLKERGIKTMHYVSPSVWAWRAERIHKIKRAADRMLTLFPFEAGFYRQHHIPVRYVGHPLADAIPLRPDRVEAQKQLNLPRDKTIIGILPGSRVKEVQKTGPIFCAAIAELHKTHPDWEYAVPLATPQIRNIFEQTAGRQIPEIPLHRFDRQQAQNVMIASDLLMVASGTATLEALLCKRPMVVTYKMSSLTWWYMKKKLIVNRYALPNHLSDQDLVTELYQEKARPQAIADEIQRLHDSPVEIKRLKQEFTKIHKRLRCDASERAADAVMELLDE